MDGPTRGRERNWGAAAGTVLLLAMALGIVSNQASRWVNARYDAGPSISASVAEIATPEVGDMPAHHANLKIPLLVTSRQRAMVARMKHRGAALRARLEGNPRLLTSLALLGASSKP